MPEDDNSCQSWLPQRHPYLPRNSIVKGHVINVRKHAKASTLRIRLESEAGGVRATVTDDGVGFSVGDGDAPGHLGFTAMRERATIAGGSLEISSTPNHGATVTCWLPADARATTRDREPVAV